MDCEVAREAISALLDGEASSLERSELEMHLAGCPGCERWRERAHELTRSVRLQAACPPVGPPSRLLEAIRREGRVRHWRGGGLAPARAALCVVGAAQLALSAPVLLLGQYHSAPLHVAHEMGSLDVALAVGFLVAACRPARAMGMLSLVGVAAVLLALTAVVDLLSSRTGLADEAPHLLVVAGWLLLRRLACLAPPSGERPRGVLEALSSAEGALAGRLFIGRRTSHSSVPLRSGTSAAGARLAGEAAHLNEERAAG